MGLDTKAFHDYSTPREWILSGAIRSDKLKKATKEILERQSEVRKLIDFYPDKKELIRSGLVTEEEYERCKQHVNDILD